MRIALVGAGGRGEWFADCIPGLGERIVALCDVNDLRAAASFAKHPGVPIYRDFRVMFDEMADDFDAVICATPDHTHAPISAMAIRAGKHIYCEKPLTHNVVEARTLRDLAREYGVATQMGNQGTASSAFREALAIIQAGDIGEVEDVYVWKDSGGPGPRPLPEGEEEIPEHLSWDPWLGPASERPYHSAWLNWHTWRDFGTTQLGNWATHTANLAFMALRVDTLWYAEAGANESIGIDVEVSESDDHSFPRWERIRFHIPPREGLAGSTLHYTNGDVPGARDEIEDQLGRRLDWGDAGEKRWDDHAGTLIVGSKGRLWANGHNTVYALLPEDDFADYEGPPGEIEVSPGHEREWLNACRGAKPAWANFEYADPLAEFLHLGNIATQCGETIEFDPVACRIGNNAKADGLLRREYRAGWAL